MITSIPKKPYPRNPSRSVVQAEPTPGTVPCGTSPGCRPFPPRRPSRAGADVSYPKLGYCLRRHPLWLGLAASAMASGEAEAAGTLLEMTAAGGWAMWPLLACSIAACFLAFRSLGDLRLRKFVPAQGRGELTLLVRTNGPASAALMLRSGGTAGGCELADALDRWEPESGQTAAERIETALGDGLSRLEARHAGRIHYLSIVANLAPMLGLLGTVSGMIGAFGTLSDGGMGQAELLAGDIGEALITTAAGLLVGIPALLAFHALRGMLRDRMDALERCAEGVADGLPRVFATPGAGWQEDAHRARTEPEPDRDFNPATAGNA